MSDYARSIDAKTQRVSQGLRRSRLHYNQTSSPVLFSSSIQRKVKPFHWKIRLKPQSMYTCILAVRKSNTIFCDHAVYACFLIWVNY